MLQSSLSHPHPISKVLQACVPLARLYLAVPVPRLQYSGLTRPDPTSLGNLRQIEASCAPNFLMDRVILKPQPMLRTTSDHSRVKIYGTILPRRRLELHLQTDRYCWLRVEVYIQ
jgi:hypothetical protein